MKTEEYITIMRNSRRVADSVAARQTMCYYLKENNIPFQKIASVLKISTRMAYIYYYRTRDLAETKDALIAKYMDEVKAHKISIRPIMVNGDIQDRILGYALLIDDIIY